MKDDILKRLRAPELYTETSGQELLRLAADHIRELERVIDEKDDEIGVLACEVDDGGDEIRHLERQVEELKDEIRGLREKVK